MQRLEVSCAVQLIYIYVVRRQRVNKFTLLFSLCPYKLICRFHYRLFHNNVIFSGLTGLCLSQQMCGTGY